jgi:uncharacterized protein (TIGR00730 family)
MKKVAVYCGSSAGNKDIYREETRKLGQYLAQKEVHIIFGGGQVGLMGVLADAALKEGGRVTGIIPAFLNVKEVAHAGLSEQIRVSSMHERKALIEEMSDGFIALPGGYGTMDEVFEMMTWSQLGLHRKPVGILNINGYYDPMREQLDRMVEEGFLRQENKNLVTFSDQARILLDQMLQFSAPLVPKWL